MKPGGQNDGYFFKADLLESSLTGPAPALTVTTSRGTQTLKHRGNAFVRGPIAGGAANLSGPLVFVGFGMKDAAVGYDDYKGLDVNGKIVVALYGSPKGIDSEVGAHLQSEQTHVAAAHGANYRVLRAPGDADGRPQWYANDYFGDLFAPKAVKAQN